jgi:hypothetical protein
MVVLAGVLFSLLLIAVIGAVFHHLDQVAAMIGVGEGYISTGKRTKRYLTKRKYRDAVRYVHTQTRELLDKGYTVEQISDWLATQYISANGGGWTKSGKEKCVRLMQGRNSPRALRTNNEFCLV